MNVRPKKHLGQHFLNDETVVFRMVQNIDFKISDFYFEVGPGMGFLTKALLPNLEKLIVVEIDTESVTFLEKQYNKEKLEILSADFLKVDLKQFKGTISVLGNFPYNISSQILFKILEEKEQVNQMVGMFQKEVGMRLCAKPNNKSYGILSVLLQYYYDAEYLFTIEKEAFNPPPKVQSGIVRLTRKTTNEELDYPFFKHVVKTAFQQRRKKLRNALKSILTEETTDVDKFLNLRAEQLLVKDFVELTQALGDGKKGDKRAK